MKKLIAFISVLTMFLGTSCTKVETISKGPMVPQMQNYPSATIGEYRLRGGNVVLRSNLINLPEEAEEEKKKSLKQMSQILNSRGITAYVRSYITNTQSIRTLTFDEDCKLDVTLDIPYPMFVYISQIGEIYMCPGDTAYVNLDLAAKSREELFKFDGTGVCGEVNRLMQKISPKYLSRDLYSSCDITTEDQIDSLMTWRDQQVARLDSMVVKMNEGLPELAGCSPLASDIIRTKILVWYQTMIMDAHMRARTVFIDKNAMMIDGEKWYAFLSRYYDYLAPREKHLLDNPLFMIGADDTYFNRLAYSVFDSRTGLNQSYPLRFDPETYAMLGELSYTQGKKIELCNKYVREKLHINPNCFSAQVCLMYNILGSAVDGIASGKNADVIADNVSYIMPYITNPELARIATLTYRDYVRNYEVPEISNKPMTKGDSIFQRIIEPYKGNVLVVDFWEMSCGPCRGGMLNERDEVKALADRPIKFLYITDNTPDQCNKWLDENEIKGEHIFITRAEWSHLQEKFNFGGIPFHILVDKFGKIHNYQSRQTYYNLLGD